MASYANPRRKPINTSGRRLAEGLSRMGDTFMKDAQASKDKKARDVEEAKQLLDKRQKSADKSFMKGWDTAQSAINVASDSFSDANEDVFRSEVIGLADGKRDQISTWIQEHPDASLIQIDEKINEGTRFLGNLNNTLTNLEAARLQYEAARDLKPGEEGALVPGYNPELIKFFEAQDMNSENMHLTVDDNGGFRISLVDEQELGNTLDTLNEGESLEFTSFNATDMLDNAVKGDGFFRTVEPFDYTEMKDMIDSEINKTGGNSSFGTKDKNGKTLYNHQAIRDYYVNDKTGKAHLNEFATQGNSEGNWMAYGDEVLNDNGELVYSNQFDNYTPEGLQSSILDGFISELPGIPRPVALPKPTTVTTPSNAASKTRGKDDVNKTLSKAEAAAIIASGEDPTKESMTTGTTR
tara:strand:- start:1226 stop:2455 length:1230 start_codon:yes stop_codon:yes gene_type:complete